MKLTSKQSLIIALGISEAIIIIVFIIAFFADLPGL